MQTKADVQYGTILGAVALLWAVGCGNGTEVSLGRENPLRSEVSCDEDGGCQADAGSDPLATASSCDAPATAQLEIAFQLNLSDPVCPKGSGCQLDLRAIVPAPDGSVWVQGEIWRPGLGPQVEPRKVYLAHLSAAGELLGTRQILRAAEGSVGELTVDSAGLAWLPSSGSSASFQRFDAMVQPFGDVLLVPDVFASSAAAVPGGGMLFTSSSFNGPGLVRLDADGKELFRIPRENTGSGPTLVMAGELAVVNNQYGFDAYDLAGNLRWSLTLPFTFDGWASVSTLSADAQGNLAVVSRDVNTSWEDGGPVYNSWEYDGTAYAPVWAQQIAADGTLGQLWRLHANLNVGATTQPMSGRVLVLGPESHPVGGTGTLTALSSDGQTCSRYRYEGINFPNYLAATANDDVYFLAGETVGRFVHIP